ncbi:uncharacterized protein A1O9_05042 [Exophiala aquamarina CBS 119918]|uniref:DRBM domain-containing protein n=1 Tax=Exophiala aquamarina CBS 119918 TaxID=1182545 RepID=A0A072PKA8_9EURO|nr:uncharacterized protein A1O9_05042 [Exophiala aquamarina CBS 119918]KEF60192.1 hypothetical protein A1O9_05042 [Exophiala aquamarina CBS 119918]
MPASELPADNLVNKISLYISSEATSRDEWLGDKYLEYTLAQISLKNTSVSDGVTSLNGRLIQSLAHFRYDICCGELKARGVRQYQPSDPGRFAHPVNFRSTLLGWIGSILCRGMPEERGALPQAIMQSSQCHSSDTFQINNSIGTNADSGILVQQDSTSEDSASEETEGEIWRYTATLHELTAGKASVPIYTETAICADPAKFRCEIKYRGKKVSGEASSKKKAKHRASKKLCQLLNIGVAD